MSACYVMKLPTLPSPNTTIAVSGFTNMASHPKSILLSSSKASHMRPLTLSHTPQISLHPLPSLLLFTQPSSTLSLKLPLTNKPLGPTMSTFSQCSHTNSNSHVQTGVLFSLFQEMGFSHEDTQMLLINHPDLEVISLDTLRGRLHSLQSLLGFDHLAMMKLVTKYPNVLTAMEVEDLICFLQGELEGHINEEQIRRLLLGTEPRFFVGFDKKVNLLLERGVPSEKIVHLLNIVNLTKAVCYRSLDEINKIIDFLDPFGGIGLIVRRPAILNYDLDTQLIPRTKFLIELSEGDEDGVGKVIGKLPAILSYSVEHVKSHVELLRSFAGLSDEEIFRVIMVFPNIVSASRERKLRPRIGFLKDCGLNSDEIFKFLIKAPLFLGHSFHGNIAYKLVFLVKIGYEYRTKDLAMAIGSTTRTSCENLQKVVGLFLSYGFSCEDIVDMSMKHPQILQYNHASLEKKIKYLVEEMDRDIDELLAFPAFLSYNLDNRIKQRFEEEKSKRGARMSINKLLTISTERFTRKRKDSQKLMQ